MKTCWFINKFICSAALLLLCCASVSAQESVSYTKVNAIFQDKCIACHSHTARSSGLNLESFEGLMNGGKRGASIIPGKGNESLLVKYVDGTLNPRMPLGDQLSAEEIAVIRAWIDAGAKNSAADAVMPAPAKPEATDKTIIPDIRPATNVKAAISALAFQPGGSMLALGGYKTIELLGADGRAVTKLEGHAHQVRGLAFSADGKLLAAAGGNPGQYGEIKIWNVAEKKEVASIRGHRDNIFAIAFSPDGRLLASCSYDRMVKLWDVATGKEIRNLKDHTDAVFSIAFSPDGRLLASASADRTIKIWNVATGERLYTLGDGMDAMNTVAFHPSGKMLAGAGADRVIRVWEVSEKEGKQLRSLIAHEETINQLTYSPDGKTLVSTSADRTIKFWDAMATTLIELKTLETQPDWIFAMSYSPDGKALVVGRYDGSVMQYNLSNNQGIALK